MAKSKYQKNLEWDDMNYGEAYHYIGKKMTEKVEKTKRDYKKPKYKNWDEELQDE